MNACVRVCVSVCQSQGEVMGELEHRGEHRWRVFSYLLYCFFISLGFKLLSQNDDDFLKVHALKLSCLGLNPGSFIHSWPLNNRGSNSVSPNLLVGYEMVRSLWKTVWLLLRGLNRVPTGPSNSAPRYRPKRNGTMWPSKHLYTDVHSIIHHGQEVDPAQVSTNPWADA